MTRDGGNPVKPVKRVSDGLDLHWADYYVQTHGEPLPAMAPNPRRKLTTEEWNE